METDQLAEMVSHSNHSIDTFSTAIDLNNASLNHLSHLTIPSPLPLPLLKQACEPGLSVQRSGSLPEPLPVPPPDRLPLPAALGNRREQPASADRLDHHSPPNRDHLTQFHAHAHSPWFLAHQLPERQVQEGSSICRKRLKEEKDEEARRC